MYITNTTDKVREFFEELLEQKDYTKLKVLIYVLNALYNNQINNKGIANPDLTEEDIEIFKYSSVGLDDELVFALLAYLVAVYNLTDIGKEVYLDDNNVVGMKYDKNEEEILSKYEKMTFNEKLDILSELLIRYDNFTYFEERITFITLGSDITGFDIAKLIQDYKK